MTDTGVILEANHNLSLVILSVMIAITASYTALDLAGRVTVAQGDARMLWLAGGAVVMGVGIWSMHFIAMLAYNLPVPVEYNFKIVLASMAVAVVASAAVLFVVSRKQMKVLALLGGSIFMGLGIAAMHYTGMVAMQLEAFAQYDPKLVALSIAIAIGASLIALQLAFQLRTATTVMGGLRKIGSAIIMGNAIAGMHYTAMAAVSFKSNNQLLLEHRSLAMDHSLLGVGIGVATLVILAITLLTSLFEWRISIETARSETLRQSEERFRSLVQNSSDIVAVISADGTVSYKSPSIKRILGYEPENWQKAFEFVHPDDIATAENLLTKALNSPNVNLWAEFRLQHANGQMRDFEVIINNLLSNPSVAGIVNTYRDINERKQAEAQIKKLNDDLKRRADELEAANKELEAFSYSVSHDLRAPLRGMHGFSRILLNEYAPQLAPEARYCLQMVQDNAQQMGHLIDDLLTFSRLSRSQLKKQPIAPTALVYQVLADLRHEQQDRKLEISIGDLPICQGDPALLKQVWINLLANALKFTRQQEIAIIEVGYEQIDAEPIYFIRDNGVGFDMQYAHKLFGVFQRLHSVEEYEGTGVGLAIVQRIVHRHGGRVWAKAEVNKGATFYFTLGGDVRDDGNSSRNSVSGGQSQRQGIGTPLLEKQ